MKEVILPQIKLKYFSIPKHGGENFVCFQCKRKSDKIGSTYIKTNPPQLTCEECAIRNFAYQEGFKSLKVATARRRRLFDIQYLFHEKIIDSILEKEDKKYKELTEEESQEILNVVQELWNDMKFITKKEKIVLEEIFDQDEIEEILDEMLRGVSLHRVDIRN